MNVTRRTFSKGCAHGDCMIFVLDVLMDCVISEARESKASAREKHFDLISRREFANAIEDVGGTLLG